MKIFFFHPFIVDKRLQVTSKNEFARGVSQLGHSIDTVVGYERLKIPLSGFSTVKFIPVKTSLGKVFLYSKTIRTLFNSSYDCTIVSNSVAWALPFIYLRNRLSSNRIKVVSDIRTIPVDETRFFVKSLKILKFRIELVLIDFFSDGLSVITEATKEEVRPYISRINHICVWGSGVNLSQFELDKKDRIHRENELSTRIIYHGHVSKERGLDTLIQGCILAQEKVRDIELVIIGSGPYFEFLETSTIGHTWIKILRPVPYTQIQQYLINSHIGIVPLSDLKWWRLSSPLKLMEYIAADLFIIASDIRSHQEMKESFQDIQLFEASNEVELSNKIIEAIKSLKEGHLPLYQDKGEIDWKAKAAVLLRYIEEID